MRIEQTTVRRALVQAGHGPVATDSFGGDGLIGFFTYPTPQSVLVGFGAAYGQFHRVDGAVVGQLRPAMLEQYARSLRDAGFNVHEAGSTIRVSA